MRAAWLGLLVPLSCGLAPCGLPGAARAALPPIPPAEVAQMAQMFDALCLRAFPDDRAVDAAAGRYGGRPLAPQEVRSYLHDDPGRGWQVARPEATYVVTLEAPPYHACAVRRMTPGGFPAVQPFDLVARQYAAARQRALGEPVTQSLHRPDGLDIDATVQQLGGGAPDGVTDSLMVFVSNYHGRYKGPLAADAGKPGIEVRFVHQLRMPGVPP